MSSILITSGKPVIKLEGREVFSCPKKTSSKSSETKLTKFESTPFYQFRQ